MNDSSLVQHFRPRSGVTRAIVLWIAVSTIPSATAGFIPTFTIQDDSPGHFLGFINYVCSICVGGQATVGPVGVNWAVTVTEAPILDEDGSIIGQNINVQGRHLVAAHAELKEIAPAVILSLAFGPVVAGGRVILPAALTMSHDVMTPAGGFAAGPHDDMLLARFRPVGPDVPDVSRLTVELIHTPEPSTFTLLGLAMAGLLVARIRFVMPSGPAGQPH